MSSSENLFVIFFLFSSNSMTCLHFIHYYYGLNLKCPPQAGTIPGSQIMGLVWEVGKLLRGRAWLAEVDLWEEEGL